MANWEWPYILDATADQLFADLYALTALSGTYMFFVYATEVFDIVGGVSRKKITIDFPPVVCHWLLPIEATPAGITLTFKFPLPWKLLSPILVKFGGRTATVKFVILRNAHATFVTPVNESKSTIFVTKVFPVNVLVPIELY